MQRYEWVLCILLGERTQSEKASLSFHLYDMLKDNNNNKKTHNDGIISKEHWCQLKELPMENLTK